MFVTFSNTLMINLLQRQLVRRLNTPLVGVLQMRYLKGLRLAVLVFHLNNQTRVPALWLQRTSTKPPEMFVSISGSFRSFPRLPAVLLNPLPLVSLQLDVGLQKELFGRKSLPAERWVAPPES